MYHDRKDEFVLFRVKVPKQIQM